MGKLTVSYNNENIINTTNDGSFTLATKGKLMADDVSVMFEKGDPPALDVSVGIDSGGLITATATQTDGEEVVGTETTSTQVPLYSGSTDSALRIEIDTDANHDPLVIFAWSGARWMDWIPTDDNTIDAYISHEEGSSMYFVRIPYDFEDGQGVIDCYVAYDNAYQGRGATIPEQGAYLVKTLSSG